MVIDRDNIKILLFILILGLGIGYAYINSDLNINGTAQVKSANWDVHWANIQVDSGSVSGTNVVTAPSISNSTTVSYSIILNTPGDYYEFTVDAVNGGSIDAMIDTIDSKLNGATITTLPDYLKYTVTYEDGIELEQNHELLANTTETYKVRLEYRTDININQLPSSNQTLSLEFAVTYRQATTDSVEVLHQKTVYTVNTYDLDGIENEEYMIHIGQSIPNRIVQYENSPVAIAALKQRVHEDTFFCLKNTVLNEKVTETYIEFIITDEMIANVEASYMEDCNNNQECIDNYEAMTAGTYIIRGGGYSDAYEANKETLDQAFGSTNCHAYFQNGMEKSYSCRTTSYEPSSVYDVGVHSDGDSHISTNQFYCGAYATGESFCGDGIY